MLWFRLYAEFSADPVVQSLAFEDQRHFVVILCLKCEGLLDRQLPENRREAIIARAIGLDPVASGEAKRRLMEVGLIDKKWQPVAWNKRQFISDDVNSRVRKSRKNKETGNVSVTVKKRYCNAPDTDTDTTSLRSVVGPKRKQNFSPPTQAEVFEYCESRGNSVDAAKWHAYYTSNGWRVGKNPMKDWRGAVRTWEQEGQHKPPQAIQKSNEEWQQAGAKIGITPKHGEQWPDFIGRVRGAVYG